MSENDDEFFDYLINKIDESIGNVIKEQENDVFPYDDYHQKEADREKINEWYEHFKNYFSEYINCRCTPMPQGNLWAAVFYITVDYDQFTREHRN